MNDRKTLIKQLHILKSKLGLDEDTYRDMLFCATGKTSSIFLDEKELRRLVLELKFKSRRTQPDWLRHLYSRAKAVLGADYRTRLHQFCFEHLGLTPEQLDEMGRKSAHAFLTQMEVRK